MNFTIEEAIAVYSRTRNRIHPDPNTGCYLWDGEINEDGYAKFSIRKDGHRRHIAMNRLVWCAENHRPIPTVEALSTRRKEFSFSLLSSIVHMDLPAPCGAAVCDLHAREVAEDRHYCADHWRAWENVA